MWNEEKIKTADIIARENLLDLQERYPQNLEYKKKSFYKLILNQVINDMERNSGAKILNLNKR